MHFSFLALVQVNFTLHIFRNRNSSNFSARRGKLVGKCELARYQSFRSAGVKVGRYKKLSVSDQNTKYSIEQFQASDQPFTTLCLLEQKDLIFSSNMTKVFCFILCNSIALYLQELL